MTGELLMYSESDLDASVAAGSLSREEAEKCRAFIATRQTGPAVDAAAADAPAVDAEAADEEYVRLLTGFNDIFVSIAIALVLGALGVLTIPTGSPGLCI